MVRDGVKKCSFSIENLKKTNDGTKKLLSLWDNGRDPECIEILNTIAKEELFDLPNDIQILLARNDEDAVTEKQSQDDLTNRIDALEEAMHTPFSHLIKYHDYVAGKASFDTHQGVKGLQFERVMVIINDEESQGSTFNYGKLLGITEKSDTDISNEQKGKETTIDRTRRLLYVTCSRAIDSLAIVFYAENLDSAYEKIIDSGWFSEDEVIPIK